MYDTVTGQATDLGPGGVGFFSPDNRLFAWAANFMSRTAQPALRVMDLQTRETWSVGDEILGRFVDDRTIRARRASANEWVDIDVFSGDRAPATGAGLLDWRPPRKGPHELRQDTYDRRTEDWWSVVEHETGRIVLAFQAMRAAMADENTLAMVTPWNGSTANLFLVDVDTGAATFVATISLTSPFCPVAGQIIEDAKAAIEAVEGVDAADVELTFQPPWTPERIDPLIRATLGL